MNFIMNGFDDCCTGNCRCFAAGKIIKHIPIGKAATLFQTDVIAFCVFIQHFISVCVGCNIIGFIFLVGIFSSAHRIYGRSKYAHISGSCYISFVNISMNRFGNNIDIHTAADNNSCRAGSHSSASGLDSRVVCRVNQNRRTFGNFSAQQSFYGIFHNISVQIGSHSGNFGRNTSRHRN